jgi:hypothetical protein
MGKLLSKASSAIPGMLCDLAGFCGAGMVSYGAWRVYEPAGFLVGGVLLIVGAVLFGNRFSVKPS